MSDLLKRLEDAKSSLRTAKMFINSEVKNAKEELKRQKGTLCKANSEVIAANARHSKLKALIESDKLCDKCWELFPAIDHDKTTQPAWIREMLNASLNDFRCVNCKLSLHRSWKLHKLPPRIATYLNNAENACKTAEAAIKGEPPLRSGKNYPNPDKEWEDHYPNAEDMSYLISTQDIEKSKSDVLLVAEEQKKKAQKQVDYTNYCIENWTKYYQQHKDQLKRVKKALESVEQEERQILESKLSKLSGGKRKRDDGGSPQTECVICMEREKEIVFQCGHQCCSVCAPKISHCHTCRELIKQKIKLHG